MWASCASGRRARIPFHSSRSTGRRVGDRGEAGGGGNGRCARRRAVLWWPPRAPGVLFSGAHPRFSRAAVKRAGERCHSCSPRADSLSRCRRSRNRNRCRLPGGLPAAAGLGAAVMKPKHPARWIAGGLFLLAAAAIAAPYFGADSFAATIKQELERTLGRKVEINGESHFRLLPRPGFSVADVVIHEDPKIGVEQFAYVPLLHVDVGASSLWKWRIEFASLRLDSPSINLMKAADGRWNVQSLADRARREAVGSLPGIEVSEGRLNFKSRDLKSVYYLAETDLSVEGSGSQQLSLRFSGVPARTDRPAHGFGRLSGRGSVSVPERGAGRLELNLALERTAAAEILTLLQGRGAGLGGFVRSQARLVGGWSNIEISGRMELDDFERWGWLFPGNSGWGMDYKGALDLENQTLEVETRAPERAAAVLPLSVRLRATRLSADTSWGALITLRGVPLDSMRSLAEEIGTEIPAGLPLQGTLTGALGYSPAGGFRGKVAVAEASVTLPD